MPWEKSSISSTVSLTDIVGKALSCGSPRSTIRGWCGQSFKFKFSDFRFVIFAGELYDIAPAFEPLLCATHHAHDLAGFLAVEVRVVKGSLFTPPPQFYVGRRLLSVPLRCTPCRCCHTLRLLPCGSSSQAVRARRLCMFSFPCYSFS